MVTAIGGDRECGALQRESACAVGIRPPGRTTAERATPTQDRSSGTVIWPVVSPGYPISASHLIPVELFASLTKAGFEVGASDLGENNTTAGLDFERMPRGTLIVLGPTALIELTGLRTPCVLIDRFRAGLKRQVFSSAETGRPFK